MAAMTQLDASSDFQILDRAAVTAMSSAFRQELLDALAEPDSAASLARRFDMSRQRIGYHMRELEKAGCIELAGERQQRGLTERLFRVRPLAYVFAPGARDRRRLQDRYAWVSLLNLLAGALWDLVTLRRRADAADKRLATLAIEAELRFASPAARKAFTADLVTAVESVIARHDQPDAPRGRSFRVVLGAYPRPPADAAASGSGADPSTDTHRSTAHEQSDTRH